MPLLSRFKHCPGCGLYKAATPEMFRRHRGRPLGLDLYCKPCASARHADWSRRNRPHLRAYRKQWDKVSPKSTASRLAAVHADRARRSGQGGSFSAKELRAAMAEAKRCYYCGVPGKLEIDHAIPLSRGGANDISNLRFACQPCNKRKGTKTADEYIALGVPHGLVRQLQ